MRIRTRWTMYRPGVHLSWDAIWRNEEIRSRVTSLAEQIAEVSGTTPYQILGYIRGIYEGHYFSTARRSRP